MPPSTHRLPTRRRRRFRLLLALAISLPVFIFLAAVAALFLPLHAGSDTSSLTIQVGSLERHYLLHLPHSTDSATSNSINSGPLPLLLVLHGATQSPESAERMTGFSKLADQHNFIVAYPSGTSRRGFVPTWNAGNCCGYAAENQIDDVAFIRALLDQLERDHHIDPKRIYATGISNGAMMSYRLACELSARIAAIAPVEGAQGVDCHPSHKVSVIVFHGTADRLVPFDGGSSAFQVGRRRTDTSVSSTLAFWTALDACSNPPVTDDSDPVLHTTKYDTCKDDSAVELFAIQGGRHMWPGYPLSGNSVPASDLIYSFFSSHPKP